MYTQKSHMTSSKIFIILLLLFLALFLLDVSRAASQVPQPPPEQQRPDIFPCSWCNDDRDGDGKFTMQDYNLVSIKAKQARSIAYRVITLPGCVPGTIPGDLNAMNVHVQNSLDNFVLTRNDQTFDFTVYISCGITHINKCGSINVFCLPDGFPFNQSVYLSDILSTYTAGSRLSIPLHEIIGHAIATWNEQYAVCGSSCGFASTPSLVDFMNTGPLSRQGFEANTLARWSRTMYVLDVHKTTQVPDSCPGPLNADGLRWDQCIDNHSGSKGMWIGPVWDFDVYATFDLGPHRFNGVWYSKQGNSEWGAVTTYRDASGQVIGYTSFNFRLDRHYGLWFHQCTYNVGTGGPWLRLDGRPC